MYYADHGNFGVIVLSTENALMCSVDQHRRGTHNP
jgi:hypothetical protein